MQIFNSNIRYSFLAVMVTLFLPFSLHNNESESKRTYTVGYMRDVFNDVDANDAKAAIKVWINEIVKAYHYTDGYNLKAKLYNQFDEVSASMKSDSLAILGLNTYDYLTNSNKIGLDPVLVPSVRGDIYSQYYILVRSDGRYKGIQDLKGAELGILSSVNHTASRIWLKVLLAKNKIPDGSKYFKKITSTEKESQLILNLFFGHIDACIVSIGGFGVMKELNPQVGVKIIPIQTSPKFLWGLVCFTKPFLDEKDRNLFYTSAVHVHELVTGKQLFSLIKIEKLVTFKSEYLNSYKELLKEYTYLLKVKKIKNDEFN